MNEFPPGGCNMTLIVWPGAKEPSTDRTNGFQFGYSFVLHKMSHSFCGFAFISIDVSIVFCIRLFRRERVSYASDTTDKETAYPSGQSAYDAQDDNATHKTKIGCEPFQARNPLEANLNFAANQTTCSQMLSTDYAFFTDLRRPRRRVGG